MNEASRWRLSIAGEIGAIFATNPKVAAILAGGSSARGCADRYSDIDLGVFWHSPPTDDDRQQASRQINGDLIRLYPYDPGEAVWSDDYMIGRAQTQQTRSGVLLEIAHYTTDFVDLTVADVLERFDPDLSKQNLVAGIVDGSPLYNIDLVKAWQKQASHYPESLTRAVIRRYAQIDHFWRTSMWINRSNNLMMLYQSFTTIQQQLLHMLLGLNGVYYFGFKWLDVLTGRLAHKPTDLVERLASVYGVEPSSGARMLTGLVEETYDLIEQLFPDIDVAWLRSVFRFQRPLWAEPPPNR